MNVTIERARAYDAPAVSSIMSDWIAETDWMPNIHTEAEYAGFGAWLIDIMDVTIARQNGEAVGFVANRLNDIHSLYLTNNARGQGIGTRLLADQKRKQDHLQLWTFQANKPARAFYQSHGFVEAELTEGVGNDEKLPDVRLIWAKET